MSVDVHVLSLLVPISHVQAAEVNDTTGEYSGPKLQGLMSLLFAGLVSLSRQCILPVVLSFS